jgi:hypothetical protein
MRVAIHQPNYLPYPGFFQKMSRADLFILLDTVQFSMDSFTQRVRIRTRPPQESIWLRIPVPRQYRLSPIEAIPLSGDPKWKRRHKMTIDYNYMGTRFFDQQFVETYYGLEVPSLREWNEYGIRYLKDRLGIRTPVVWASELGVNRSLKATDLIISIVDEVGGETYISGSSGRKYLEEGKFGTHGITLEYFDFHTVEYKQKWEGFIPYMSTIDLLFNQGEDASRDLIHG